MKQKILSIFLSLAMVITMTPAIALTAFAEGEPEATMALAEDEPEAITDAVRDENYASEKTPDDESDAVTEIQAQEQTEQETPEIVTTENGAVAQIGEMEYNTLAEAVKAAPTGGTEVTIKMIADETIDGNAGVTIEAGKNIVLDLNGRTVKNAVNEDKASQVITNKGTLTIKDETGNGVLKNEMMEGAQAGDWWSTPQYNWATNVIVNQGKLTVESGTIYQTAQKSICYAIDTSNYVNTELTINGGNVKSECTAIRLWPSGGKQDLTITAGEIYGKGRGIQLHSAGNSTVKISGGSITTKDNAGYAFLDLGAGDNQNYTLYGGNFGGNIYSYGAKTSITGGIYNGYVYVKNKDKFITGGTFNDDPSMEFDKNYIADGYIKQSPSKVVNKEGYVDVVPNYVAQIGEDKYFSLAEAIGAVPDNNESSVTIELLKNIKLNSTISINKNNVVIDGKNFTISADNEYSGWEKYKVGGEKQKFGSEDLITVKGKNITVKDVTIDIKDYRGMSCMTTKSGENVTYENVTYEGRGSGHYYGYGKGTITFTDCEFKTKGYAVHCSSENPGYAIIIDSSIVQGWNSFGGASKIMAKNSTFYGANDEGKNGLLAKFRPYSDTAIINCKFSEDYLSEATNYCGIDSGAEALVKLDGCSVIKNDGTASTHKAYELVDYRDSDSDESTIFAIDAKGDATNGYSAGTFVTKDKTFKVADGYQLNEITMLDTVANVYTVTAKAEANGDKIKVGGEEITVEGTGEGEGKPTAEQAATAITDTLKNPEVTGFTDTKIEDATKVTEETTIRNVDDTEFDLSMILDAVKDEAAKKFKSGEAKASANGEITVKTTVEGDGEKFGDTDVTKQITVNLKAAAVETVVDTESTTTVTSMTFEVKPVANITVTNSEGKAVTVTAVIPNEAITAPITFLLPVNSSVNEKWAAVYHKGTFIGNYEIETGSDNNKFIKVSSKEFSEFSYVIINSKEAGAQIGDVPYQTFAEAVLAVRDDEIIKLLKNTKSETITVSRDVTFTVDNNEKTNNATIVAGEGYELTKSGNTYTVKKKSSDVSKKKVAVELLQAKTSGKKAVKLSWNSVSGATKYVVYGQKCGNKYKKLKTTTGKTYTVKKIKGKKLKAHKTYKFYVVAYTSNGKVQSNSIHFITAKTQGKYANAKSITVNPSTLTLVEGKAATIKTTTKIYKNKKHIKKNHGVATRFISDCPTVATVSSNGVVTAKAPGTATIYVQDIGGLWTKTAVTVK